MNPEKAALESFASIDAKRISSMPRRIRREPANGFGVRLATLRKQAGITQTAPAGEIGVSQRMMAYYEGPSANRPANLRRRRIH
jgi:hypothetical protein